MKQNIAKELIAKRIIDLLNLKVELHTTNIIDNTLIVEIDNHKLVGLNKAKFFCVCTQVDNSLLESYDYLSEIIDSLAKEMVKKMFPKQKKIR